MAIKSLTESHEQLKNEMRASCKASEEATNSIKTFSKNIASITEDVGFLNRAERNSNILIFNLEEKAKNESDLLSKVSAVFQKVILFLNIVIPDLAIADVYRIEKSTVNRPIMVKFIAPPWVKVVFSKIKEFNNIGLAVSNDRSPQKRKIRKELLVYANTLREKGFEVKLKNDFLLVNDEKVKLNNLERFISRLGKSSSRTPPPMDEDVFIIPTPASRKGKRGRPTKLELDSRNSKRGTGLDEFLLSGDTPRALPLTRSTQKTSKA